MERNAHLVIVAAESFHGRNSKVLVSFQCNKSRSDHSQTMTFLTEAIFQGKRMVFPFEKLLFHSIFGKDE